MNVRLRISAFVRDAAVGLSVVLALASCSGPPIDERAADSTKTLVAAVPEVGNAKPRLRTITRDQYLNTLAYLFGPDVRPDVDFPPVERIDGLLQLGNSSAGVNDSQLELYQKTAQYVARQVIAPERRNYIIPCKPINVNAADAACAAKVLTRVGRVMFRRPLESERLEELVSHANESADKLGNFYSGLAVAIEEILVSPNTMLLAERGEPDPTRPGYLRLDSYSLASRLSYFLWNAAPDDMLLDAAAAGELQTKKGRAKIVDMMIASPRFKDGVRAFFDDMFDFEKLSILAKDPQTYPVFTGVTVEDSREQTLRTIVELLVNRKADYRDLYTSRVTFLSPSLAILYQLPAPAGWTLYEFPPDSPRAGLLTHVSFLAGHSHPGRSSATLRGKALRELLLCQPVPRPPANVDFSALENPRAEFRTARDRINFHLENPVCAGCHRITDPIGLALENFDGSGRFREAERGVKIDPAGNLDGKAFKDVTGLGESLHDHPGLTPCLVKRVYAYGTGNATSNADSEVLKFLNSRFEAQGFRFTELTRTIALTPAFAAYKPVTPPETEKTTSASSSRIQTTR